MTRVIAVSLEPTIEELLNECAARFGITKSKLVGEVLREKLPGIKKSDRFSTVPAIYPARTGK